MYLVDCSGLTPGEYFYYNILLWGLMGLLLYRPRPVLPNFKVEILFDLEETSCIY